MQEKLAELAAEEAQLHHYVTGQSFTDGYGLVHPPREPLQWD
jgi:hypothetical protein